SVSLLIAHGATDAPAVDIRARDVGLLVEGAKYGDIASGLTVPAAAYTIDVLAAGTSTIVASFALDLTELGGGAAIAYASGFLDPSANGDGPGFQLGTTLADGSSATAAVVTSVDGDNTVPESLRLGGNYPNPFTGSTTIAFDLAENANVDVNVYDLTGRQVARVADSFTAGTNRQVVVDLADRPSGVYLYRLQVEGTTGVESVKGRMILTR
ncbi:MAG: T9SS type A sorting domain-containing protein, partial [Bacteroidetes bacterium]|nr:T9SS type A sorting domain-containing protein [Bacteroidota bacterium]